MLAQLVLSDFNVRKICAQIYLALHFPSNYSRYSMLATLFFLKLYLTLNVLSKYSQHSMLAPISLKL